MQTNYPSIKRIMETGCSRETARQIKEVFTMKRGALNERFEAAAHRTRECYNPPSLTDLRMTVIDSLLGTYGVEAFETRHGYCEYCNAGDTYTTTILYHNGRFSVGCWGDIAEREVQP